MYTYKHFPLLCSFLNLLLCTCLKKFKNLSFHVRVSSWSAISLIYSLFFWILLTFACSLLDLSSCLDSVSWFWPSSASTSCKLCTFVLYMNKSLTCSRSVLILYICVHIHLFLLFLTPDRLCSLSMHCQERPAAQYESMFSKILKNGQTKVQQSEP